MFIGNPRYRYGARAAVCGDTMYLLCGTTLGPDREYSNDLHALDLATWTWRRLSPRGRPPVRCAYLSVWPHDGKVYGFGGETDDDPHQCTNQFFYYDAAADCWGWPSVRGRVPGRAAIQWMSLPLTKP